LPIGKVDSNFGDQLSCVLLPSKSNFQFLFQGFLKSGGLNSETNYHPETSNQVSGRLQDSLLLVCDGAQ
jgi:hypothetical protein